MKKEFLGSLKSAEGFEELGLNSILKNTKAGAWW